MYPVNVICSDRNISDFKPDSHNIDLLSKQMVSRFQYPPKPARDKYPVEGEVTKSKSGHWYTAFI